MKYSVIVPAYNCERTLAACVGSIQESGLREYELILVDDGSADGTAQLCDALALQNAEIRVIHQKNAGVSAARNRGIEDARGDYILFADADDTLEPASMQHILDTVEAEQPDLLIFGETFDYYFQSRMYRRETVCYPENAALFPAQWGGVFEKLFDCNALSPVWNKVIRRSLLIENKIRFDKNVFEMEDFLFSVRCLTYCSKLCTLPDAVYHYRQAEDERSTYRRLCRVESLSAYMQPFEEAVGALSAALNARGSGLENADCVLQKIYAMFVHEMLRYGSPAQLRQTGCDLLNGRYASGMQAREPGLYRELSEEKYGKIRWKSLRARLRHFAAVRYKYLRSL